VLTHNDDGIRFGKGARIKEAMKDFDTAIRLAPDDPDAWAERAFCKLESGQYPIEYALDDYEEALALDPKNLQATWGIAFVNYKKENYPAAYEGLKKVLSINPEVRRAYIYKASIEISIFKNFDAALEDCNTVIRLDPDFADAYFMRARANMELKHYRTVIKDLDTVIEKGATDITATLANRGTAKSELEDYDGAIADFTEAIKHKPTGQTYFNRGMAYGYNLKHDLAIADFNKAIALGYEPELALEWRAYSKLNAKDYAGAAVDFENIVKTKPQDAKALYNLGRAKYHSGDIDSALVYLHRANDAAPGTAYIKEYLDFVEEQKKK
jgi:tetratricopeptide (TPR) repeat protein